MPDPDDKDLPANQPNAEKPAQKIPINDANQFSSPISTKIEREKASDLRYLTQEARASRTRITFLNSLLTAERQRIRNIRACILALRSTPK